MTRKLWSRETIASTAHVIQVERLLTKKIFIDETLLVMVRQGQKSIAWRDKNMLVSAGEAILVSAGCSLDVTNIPQSSHVPFEAEWLSFPLLRIYDPAGPNEANMPRVLHDVSVVFRQAFDHTVVSIKDTAGIPDRVAVKRVEEMCEWLESFGLMLKPAASVMLSQRIRKLVLTDLLKNWRASEVARHFAMSEATLRRRLNAEETSFRSVVTEARMGHALALLQVTDQAVSQIALGVGYENPSKFTARFRARFGFNPGQVRAQEMPAALT